MNWPKGAEAHQNPRYSYTHTKEIQALPFCVSSAFMAISLSPLYFTYFFVQQEYY